MIYSNDDPMAILAMEQERTGNYGEDNSYELSDIKCPICEAYDPDYFYMDMDGVCIGCNQCVYKEYTL